jgi:hypothetical protein
MPPKDKKANIDLKVPEGTKDWEGKTWPSVTRSLATSPASSSATAA